VPLLPERLLLHLEPVAEEDQDERNHCQALHELRRGVEVERPDARVAEQETREDEARRQREEAALSEA
jgi:hypothetical protein